MGVNRLFNVMDLTVTKEVGGNFLFRAIAKLSLILKKQFTMTNFGGRPESPSDFFQRSIEVAK